MNFLPSGKHYFYFIKNGKFFCISNKFEVVRFKETNLYMNMLDIKERQWKITELKHMEEDNADSSQKFNKNKSVFRNFRDDSEESLKKMFELDISYSKINRIVKNNESEINKIKDVLWSHY